MYDTQHKKQKWQFNKSLGLNNLYSSHGNGKQWNQFSLVILTIPF